MLVSEERRAINRRNAQLSTGPKTAEGKARSSRNATKHGLTARRPPVGPEAEQARAARVAACRAVYAPGNEWECFLVDELAAQTLKLARFGPIEVELRAIAATRAESDLWHEDRSAAVATIGLKLAQEPARVVARLRQSSHGCDWLIERWAGLARLADTTGWAEEQTQLAHDLLATPSALRTGPIGCPIDELGHVVGPDLDPGTLARTMITDLQALRDLTAESDAATRAVTAADLADIPSHDVALLRRYERATLRRLSWIMDQIAAAGLEPQTPVKAKVPIDHPALTFTPALVSIPAERPPAEPEISHPAIVPSKAILLTPTDATKPISIDELRPNPTPKRPDLAKLAKRDRKARRKRGQKQHSS